MWDHRTLSCCRFPASFSFWFVVLLFALYRRKIWAVLNSLCNQTSTNEGQHPGVSGREATISLVNFRLVNFRFIKSPKHYYWWQSDCFRKFYHFMDNNIKNNFLWLGNKTHAQDFSVPISSTYAQQISSISQTSRLDLNNRLFFIKL